MGYLDNMNWEQLKKEVQSELGKGLAVIKNGAIVIQKKAEKLTEEGKRQYKIMSTNVKLHNAMRDLGARVYMLMNRARIKNPALDASVKDISARINGLETELAKLEGKEDVAPVSAVSKPGAAANAKTRSKAGASLRAKKTRRRKTVLT